MSLIGRFVAFASLLITAMALSWSAPAAAQDSPGEYRASIDNMYLEMRALWGEIERFKVANPYCNPSPPPPSKAQAQAELAALEQRANDLNRRYNALKQSLLSFLDRNHRLYAEMMVNGRDPRDRQWWSREDNNRQRMLDELARKKAALAAAREVDCRPKPKPKPPVTTGGGFQAPALPVRPSPTSVTWPALPTHFCSYDEKIEFLKKAGALLDQAGADAERAARFRTEVEQAVNSYVQNDRPVPADLIARRRQAIADVEAANRRAREANDYYNRVNAIPVIDCRTPVQQEPPRTEPPRQETQTGQAAPPAKAPTLPQWARGLDRIDQEAVGAQQRMIDAVEADFRQFETFLRRRPSCTAIWDEADDFDYGLDELEEDDLVPPAMIREWRARLDRLVGECARPRIRLESMLQRPISGLPPPTDRAAIQILSIHNKERALYRLPALQWEPQLAAGAMAYAQQLARTGVRVHAPREGRGAVRENLNQGMLGWSPSQMVDNWLRERQDFIPGKYPDVTRTGRWQDVSHYTQMIWPTTTQVGCGLASGSGYQWLVCRYSPGGNKDGMTVGLPQPVIADQSGIAPPNSSTPTIPRLDPRDMPRVGGGMTQIDPPPPPPPTARDDAPEGKEENHPLVRYAQAADAQHATETDCGNAAMARLELEKMRYALDELKKRLKDAKKARRLGIGAVNPDDVQRQIDDLERRIRDAEQRKPRPRTVCPPPPPPPPPA